MQAVLWRDFLCPWCHLGRARTTLLEDVGVTVTARAYDLHPEVPPDGRPIRPDGRFAALLERIGDECRASGLALRRPERIPNTRRALETGELVGVRHPEVATAVDAAFFDAVWVDGRDLGDPAVVDDLLARLGLDPAPITAARDRGEGARLLEASMADARDHGVTGTPAWWVDDRLLIPGVQEATTVQRWVERLRDRREAEPGHR